MQNDLVWPAIWSSSGAWSWQLIGVAVSLLSLALYWCGYVVAHRRGSEETFTLPGYLCLFGVGASLAWLLMPLLPQPRFPGIVDWLSGNPPSWIGIATQVFGAVVGARYLSFTARSTVSNWSVTYHRFFAPERLLTDGPYGVVRHPMLAGDFLAHAGIALAFGGLYTIVLLPIYYLINEAFVEIQERYVLRPKFGDAYRAYARAVPRMFDRNLLLVTITGAALVAAVLWSMGGTA